MNRITHIRQLAVLPVCLVFCMSPNPAALGQQGAEQPQSGALEPQNEWYYGGSNGNEPKKSIAQQKAEKRAEQRMARLEAMRWYGFSASRPTAAAMPFTSMYSPAWTQPGGRPFAWYMGGRPNIIVPSYYYRYR